jgi:hypothetical protein
MTRYDLDLLHVHYAIPHSISVFLAKMMLKDRTVDEFQISHACDPELRGLQRLRSRDRPATERSLRCQG